MRTLSTRMLCLAATLFLSVGAIPAQEPGPVERRVVTADYALPSPESIAILAAASQVILEGTVVSHRPLDVAEIHEGIVSDIVRTAFRLEDIEWIKPPRDAGPAFVELVLPTGRRQRGDRIVEHVDPTFPTPVVGERYLLFLRETAGGYAPASHGAESAFKVQGDRVVPVGDSPLSRTLAGTTREQLTLSIRGAQ